MEPLVIAAVVGFSVRFGHSFGRAGHKFGQSFGNSLVVEAVRNARHSKPLGLIMVAEAARQNSDLLFLEEKLIVA